MKKYFITGIDTDSGKTLISAVITQKLKADYWKPVQAGRPTDSEQIASWVSSDIKIHSEGILLEHPMSPHAAAKLSGIEVQRDMFAVPETNNHLIIEGAGGIMVPLNDNTFVIDLAKDFDCEVILVSRNYLGSINHTLLSIEYLKSNGYKIAGIVFNDKTNAESENYILKHSKLPCLGHIEYVDNITPEIIDQLGKNIELP